MDSRILEEEIERPDEFKTSFFISITVHGILFLVLTLKIVLFPSEPIEFKRAVRVDVVDLPDKVISELKKVEQKAKKQPKEPEKPKAPEPKKPEPKPKAPEPAKPKVDFKKSQKSAFERLKNLRKNKKQEAEPVAGSDLKAVKQIETIQYKGNILAAGTSLTGINKLQHDEYLDRVDDHVKKYWNLPEWLASSNLSAKIVVYLDKRGFVKSAKLTQSSNNTIFDQKVLESIKQASPFPQPPNKFENILEVDGLELRFPD